MYGELLEQISIPPAEALYNPINTPATDGAVGFVVVPEHEMAPHVILLVARVELCNVREAGAFQFACNLKIIVCHIVNQSPFVLLSIVIKSIYWLVSAHISIPPAASESSPMYITLDSGTVRAFSPV